MLHRRHHRLRPANPGGVLLDFSLPACSIAAIIGSVLLTRAGCCWTTQGVSPIAGCYGSDGNTPSFDGVCGGVGHTTCEGGGPRNPFGLAFNSDGNSWTVALCEADADGDGFSNGEELGDPCCAWAEGDAPPAFGADAISHPGFASAVPATPLICSGGAAVVDPGTTDPDPTTTDPADPGTTDDAAVRALIFNDGEEQASFEWSAGGVAIPAEETVYMKERISFPDSAVFSNDLFYLVGIQVHVDSSALHHLVVYQCPFEHPAGSGGLLMSFDNMGCESTIFPWAPGPTVQALPSEVGFLCGRASSTCKSIIVDVHYDNPELRSDLVDSSAITFFATPTRTHSMGTLSTGSVADPELIQVPADRTDHFDATTCIVHTDTPVRVAGNFFHAHELGNGFWTDLYRGGTHMTEIGREHNWSFDNQRYVPMDEEVALQSVSRAIIAGIWVAFFQECQQ
eukprot:COSAG04_NODE_1220_length_7696_cov_15.725286_3_plen_454_part_00